MAVKNLTLTVKGMHCSSCEQLIKMALEDLGISKVAADSRKGMVMLEFDPARNKVEQIKAAIEKEGYKVLA